VSRVAYVTASYEALLGLFRVPKDAVVHYVESVPEKQLVRVYYSSAVNPDVIEMTSVMESNAGPRMLREDGAR
jgi:hypothetical protein